MRYHFVKPEKHYSVYGEIYICDHPVYHPCTLFTIGQKGLAVIQKGLAVIQQRFDPITKSTRWTELDPWLPDVLYLNPGFKQFFNERSGESHNGLYNTVTVR